MYYRTQRIHPVWLLLSLWTFHIPATLADSESQKVVFDGIVLERGDETPYRGSISMECRHSFEVSTFYSYDKNHWEQMEYRIVPQVAEVFIDDTGRYHAELFGEIFNSAPRWYSEPPPGFWIKVEGLRGNMSETHLTDIDEEWIVDGVNPRTVFDPDRIAWMTNQTWTVHHKLDRTGTCLTLSQWGLNSLLEHSVPYSWRMEKGGLDQKFDGDGECINWGKVSRTEADVTIAKMTGTVTEDQLLVDVQFSEFDVYFHYNIDLGWKCAWFDISGDAYFDRPPCSVEFSVYFTPTMKNETLYLHSEKVISNIDNDSFHITVDNFFDGAAEWLSGRFNELLNDALSSIISENCSCMIDLQFDEYVDEEISISGYPLNFITRSGGFETYYDIQCQSLLPDTLSPFPPYQGDKEYSINDCFDISIYVEDCTLNSGLKALTQKGFFDIETEGISMLDPGHRLEFSLCTYPAVFLGDPAYPHDSVMGSEFTMKLIDKDTNVPVVIVDGTLFVAIAYDMFANDDGYIVFVNLFEDIYLESTHLYFRKNEIEVSEEYINELLRETIPILNGLISNEPILARFICWNPYLKEPVHIDLTDITLYRGWAGLGFEVERPSVEELYRKEAE
jgi:hypothetical protein